MLSTVEGSLRRTLSTKLMRRRSSVSLPKVSRNQENKVSDTEHSSPSMQRSVTALTRTSSRTISGPTAQGAAQWNYNPLTAGDTQVDKPPSLEAPGKLVTLKTENNSPREGSEADDQVSDLPNMDMTREKRSKPRRRTMPPLTRHKKDTDSLQ